MLQISDVSSTSLVTLFCHAIESRSPEPLLHDPEAVVLAESLIPHLRDSGDPLHQRLVKRRLSRPMVVHIALRARRFDQYAREFLHRHPEGVIVNLGCGMDTRFFRIDDGQVHLFDLDLPELIALKRQLISETERYHLVGSSVLDHGWLEELEPFAGRPVLYMAEGLLMYLPEQDVRRLVTELCARSPAGSELACEVFNKRWLKGPFKRILDRKLHGRLGFGKGASFQFGVDDARDLEGWHRSIRLVDEWSYFDEDEKKLGLLKLMGRVNLLRRTQWTAHYRIDKADAPQQ